MAEYIYDKQYLIEIRSNLSDAFVLVDGINKGTTPKNINIKLSEIRNSGGAVTIALEKTNFKVNEEYRLIITNNPKFGSNSNIYSRQYEFVDPNNPLAIQQNQFAGLSTANFTYSNVEPFVIDVKKFVNGVEDTNYKITDFDTNNFVFEYTAVEEKNTPLQVIPDVSTALVNFSNELLGSSKILVDDKNEESIPLATKQFSFNIGTKLTILSSDIKRYRITSVSITSNGKTEKRDANSNTQSLQVSFVVDSDTSIIVTSEEIFIPVKQNTGIEIANVTEKRLYNKNSKSDYPIALRKIGIVDSLRVVIGKETITYDNLGDATDFVIIVPQKYFTNVGVYNLNLIPRNVDGDGDIQTLSVNVVDDVWVGEPDLRNITYPSVIQGGDFLGTNVDFTIGWESVNTDYVRVSKPGGKSYIQLSPTGKQTLNVQTLLNLDGNTFSENNSVINISLKLVPYNISGKEVITGREELIKIAFSKGDLDIPRPLAVNRIADAFLSQFNDAIFDENSSKYLTHTLNFGDGDNKVITTWTGSEGSLILKLYEPLPTTITTNQQVWIAKMQSNPILETITISGELGDFCSPLKGPNFSLDKGNDIGLKIYDDLIASGSKTSNDLINLYLNKLDLDTTKLNIQYVSSSYDENQASFVDDYAFENFVNFGSAAERVKNFLYKIQLLEFYKSRLETLTGTLAEGSLLTQDFNLLLSDDPSNLDGLFEFEIEKFVFRNPTEGIDAQKTLDSLNSVLRSFDGFENFLYTSTNVLAYPKMLLPDELTGLPIYVLKPSDTTEVTNWYDALLSTAEEYDKYNPNYLVYNIPEFLKEDSENEDFLLFLDMVGQHFDLIWVFINALTRIKKLDEGNLNGVPKTFVSNILKSFGWDVRKAFDSQYLWEYAFGKTKDGVQKYSISLEDANYQVWRRILNNLPYLLKHKGTSRALKAVMACYGVPQSMLTIMEFGGPQDPTKGGTSEFTFDDRTAAILLSSGSQILIPWKSVGATSEHPQAIELMVKPQYTGSFKLVSGSNFGLSVTSSATGSVLGFNIGNYYTQSAEFSFRTTEYSNILINKTDIGATEVYNVYFKTGDGNRIFITSSLQLTINSPIGEWESGSYLKIGNDFSGALDEFRLWRTPLEETKFDNHTLFPDSINGNNYSSSTADLLFRLDFEYPKDRLSDPYIKNVAINTDYDGTFSYATASNFYTASTYPYQYEPYERTVTAKVPSLGFNYSNKIRLESQYNLIGQELTGSNYTASLSYKNRITKKSFDKSPIDSNRLGLFFSPIKELNMDILKAFGDFNIDNYIGDPSDDTKETYKELDNLRTYYFDRLERNIYEYIQLVKYIDKSLFDVLADLAPARAKISKGLLIEPHYLERNKTRWDRPTALRGDYETIVSASEDVNIQSDYPTYTGEFLDRVDATFSGELPTYEGKIDEEDAVNVEGDKPTYESLITYQTDELLEGTYPTYTSSIEFALGETLLGEVDTFGQFEQIGMDKNSIANLGFGLYAPNKTTEYKRFVDLQGNVSQSRSNVFLVTLSETKNVLTQTNPNEPLIVEDKPTTFTRRVVSVIPFNDSVTTGNSVTAVSELKGYFHTHYRYTNGLSTGLERSYFEGSKQTSATTPDGLSPVQTFTTNPNILRVAKTGRGSGEPILEVD